MSKNNNYNKEKKVEENKVNLELEKIENKETDINNTILSEKKEDIDIKETKIINDNDNNNDDEIKNLEDEISKLEKALNRCYSNIKRAEYDSKIKMMKKEVIKLKYKDQKPMTSNKKISAGKVNVKDRRNIKTFENSSQSIRISNN